MLRFLCVYREKRSVLCFIISICSHCMCVYTLDTLVWMVPCERFCHVSSIFHPLECVSFFLYLNHKCVRIAWLNFPYCPYALDSTEFLRRENGVLFFFRFVVFSHFPFVIGATNCLCTFVLATIVACRCHTYNHVNRISCLFFHVLFLFFCLTLTILCLSFSSPLFSHSLHFLSIFSAFIYVLYFLLLLFSTNVFSNRFLFSK